MSTQTDYLTALQYGAPGGGVGVNADRLDPEFARRLSALIQAAENATGDTSVKVFEGYRDPARSAQLSADYRGKAVTYGGKTYQPTPGMKGKYQAAGPMVSQHNYGMAADVRGGDNPDKYPSGPAYEWMVAHAADYGLQNLGKSDPAHFQIPQQEFAVAKTGKPLQTFKIYNPDGLTPPADIPNSSTAVGSELDVTPLAPTPMPGRPAVLSRNAAPVPMPGRPAALGASPPRSPGSEPGLAIAPRLGTNNTLSYPASSGITPAAKLAAATSSHEDAGLGALTDPRTAAMLAPARNASLVALGNLGAPTAARTLGSMDAPVRAPTVDQTRAEQVRTIANPAYAEWEKTYGTGGVNKGLGDIHDLRDDATMKAQQGTPKAPPKTITVSIAPKTITGETAAPSGGLGGFLGGVGNQLKTLGSNLGGGVQSLGEGAGRVAQDLGEKATDAVNGMIPAALRTVAGRTGMLTPILAKAMTDKEFGTIQTNPTKYGATPEQRQAEAAKRQALSEGRAVPAQTAVATSRSIAPTIVASAPKPTTSAAPSNGGKSVGSGGTASSAQTITGSSTGRQYVVGQTYSNGNGSYVAQSNGTFKRVA